jgi:putative transport protein
MDWLVTTLKTYPEIAIFLTLGIGFWFGNLKFGKFSLGVVTSTLLAGVLIGALHGHITISANVKSVFFLMFLFAVGYGVGPQFFRGLKGDGIQQVILAFVICLSVLLSAVIVGKILGYHTGLTAGLLSGAATISAVLGVATDSINQMDISGEQKKAWLDAMPVAYAVTYLFGTAGSAWFLSSIAPRLLGVKDLAEECRHLEQKMGGAAQQQEGTASARRTFDVRAFRLTNQLLAGHRVGEIEAAFAPDRAFVGRIRRNGGGMMEADPDTIVEEGAVVTIAARTEALVRHGPEIGPEVDDRELLMFEASVLDAVVTNKALVGKTLGQLVAEDLRDTGRGVFARKIVRAGQEMPVVAGLELQRGDAVTLVGGKADVERAAKDIGYADRPTEKTDMLVMGFGIVLGALIGAIVIRIGGVPLGLSTSGGALISGLVFGWLRSVNPTFGRIPAPALWVFNNIGLATFIAVVGLSTGPSFVAGVKNNGLTLFFAGIVVTILPFVIALYFGKYVLKMPAPILLGACAGGRTTTAALGAVQDAAGGSKIPALGYTVTYAVGNTLLTIWGVVVVLLMK